MHNQTCLGEFTKGTGKSEGARENPIRPSRPFCFTVGNRGKKKERGLLKAKSLANLATARQLCEFLPSVLM